MFCLYRIISFWVMLNIKFMLLLLLDNYYMTIFLNERRCSLMCFLIQLTLSVSTPVAPDSMAIFRSLSEFTPRNHTPIPSRNKQELDFSVERKKERKLHLSCADEQTKWSCTSTEGASLPAGTPTTSLWNREDSWQPFPSSPKRRQGRVGLGLAWGRGQWYVLV